MGIVTENIANTSNEHFILKGEPTLLGRWISFQCEKKKYAQYAESKNTEGALINVSKIFQTNVNMKCKTAN